MKSPEMAKARGWWLEAVPPARLEPRNLHVAQLARRLGPK